MDIKPTEATHTNTRQPLISNLTLCIILAVVLGSIILAVSFAIWFKFCRNCEHQEETNNADPDGERKSEGKGRRLSYRDYLKELPADSESGGDQDAEDDIKINICSRAGGRTSVYYSIQGQDGPPVDEHSIGDEASSNLTLDDGIMAGAVAVDIHPRPSTTKALVHSRAAGKEDDTGGSQDIEMVVFRTTVTNRRLQQDQHDASYYGLDETCYTQGNRKHELVVRDDAGVMETVAPYRVASTDLSQLEKGLDYWHQQHSEEQVQHEDDEPHSKVRYNDTGSLEKVNLEHQVEYYFQDTDEPRNYYFVDNSQYQYRQLWSLRASLAKDEHRSNKKLFNREEAMSAPLRHCQSSVDIPGSVAMASGSSKGDVSVEYSRHQMYISRTNSKLRSTEMACEIHSLEDSGESINTLDTGGSSTDTSLLEQGKSFESTSDHAENAREGQPHRLQQFRADSGYRSMENPPAPNLTTHQHSFGDIVGRPTTVYTPLSGLEPYTIAADCRAEIPVFYSSQRQTICGCDSDLEGNTKFRDILEGKNEKIAEGYNTYISQQERDEGVAGLQSPHDVPSTWDKSQRKLNRSASKKRREFGVTSTRHMLAHVVTEAEYTRSRRFQNYCDTYSRDYSVDEKTDALFREFSRCDPVKIRPSRSHRQHCKQSYTHSQILSEEELPLDQHKEIAEEDTPVITLHNIAAATTVSADSDGSPNII